MKAARSSKRQRPGMARRLGLAFVGATLVLGLPACTDSGSPATPSAELVTPQTPIQVDPTAGLHLTIGVANYSLDSPFLAAIDQGIAAEAATLGITVVSKDAGGDAGQLAADVASFRAEAVDGIIVSGGDLVSAPAVFSAMMDSRISLVLVDRLFNSGDFTAWIGPDYYSLAYDLGDFVVGVLGGRGNVAVIEGGPKAHPIGSELTDGVIAGLTRDGSDIEVIEASEFGDWTSQGGERAMTALLDEHGAIDAVFCQNDAMCLGAQKAAEAAGRSHEMILVAVGGTDQAFAAIRDDTNFAASALIDPYAMGGAAADLMARILAKQDFSRMAFVQTPRIDARNWEEYFDPARSLPAVDG